MIKYIILVITLVFNISISFSQLNVEYSESPLNSTYFQSVNIRYSKTKFYTIQTFSSFKPTNTIHKKIPTFTYEAFFCKLEKQMDKKAKMNIRMRLGSLEYVDRLEQKNQYLFQEWLDENPID